MNSISGLGPDNFLYPGRFAAPNSVSSLQGGQPLAQSLPLDQNNNVPPQNGRPQEQMIMLPSGHGSGCGHCVGMRGGLIPKSRLDAIKREQRAKIMAHEQAHASQAGRFGGTIAIQEDSNGIPISGHVPVQMPGVNPLRPEESIAHARQVRMAALAPGDPSSQDMSVAAQAAAIEGQAKALQNNQLRQQDLFRSQAGNGPSFNGNQFSRQA